MSLEQVKRFLDQVPPLFYPFEELLVRFCEKLSQLILAKADPHLHPELIALAFWLRKSHIADLEDHFHSLSKPEQMLAPRGLAFHVAPANVETLFVYSWILSLLVGNLNIVRLPSRQSEATRLLFELLHQLLEQPEFAPIAKATLLISYGHEQEITEKISAHTDVRLIWGGDATIETIRKLPIKVMGKDLYFADRYACAALRAAFFLEADQQKIAESFYRDLFWYDQQTCASPKTLFWIGPQELCQKASESLYRHLQKIAEERNYVLPLGSKMSKMTDIYRSAILLPFSNLHHYGPLTVVKLEKFHPAVRTFGGFGLLFQVDLQKIEQIADCVEQKDQTLIHAGFSEDELHLLARRINGRGFDRIVPIGRALQFDVIWDGYDLMAELTRRVVIENE